MKKLLKKVAQRNDAANEEAARKERLRLRNKQGRRSTILTGDAEILGAAPISQNGLLGD